jgi:hypothetical protein
MKKAENRKKQPQNGKNQDQKCKNPKTTSF